MAFNFKKYFLANLDDAKLSGREIVAACPWCEKAAKLYANTKTGNFICFSCEQRGRRGVDLIAEIEGISKAAARAKILKESEIEFSRFEPGSLSERLSELREDEPAEDDERLSGGLPEGFTPVFDGKRWRVPSYMKERGFVRETLRDFGIGFCNDDYWITHHGDSKRILVGGRVVIPIVCPTGESWTARAIDPEAVPKYYNLPGADKSKLLFGWNQSAHRGDLILCEGPFDAMMLVQNGFPALALLGKILHPTQLGLLCSLPRDIGITVMLDPEEIEAPQAAAAELSVYFDAVNVAKLEDGIDPGDATREQILKALKGTKRASRRGDTTGRKLRALGYR